MKNTLITVVLAVVSGLVVSNALVPNFAAAEGDVCPAVILCDENGHYYAGVDPNSPCAQHQHQFCTERRLQAEVNLAVATRFRRYTKRYSKCTKWAERVAGRRPAAQRAVTMKELKARSCSKYAARAKKWNAAVR
jgi:hypothetical protein